MDPKVADWARRYEVQLATDIAQYGQCDEESYRGKRCRQGKGHDRPHNSGDGVSWVTDIDHEGGQAHELKKLFETCKSIIPDIELPAWVEFQSDLSQLAFLLGIDKKNEDA